VLRQAQNAGAFLLRRPKAPGRPRGARPRAERDRAPDRREFRLVEADVIEICTVNWAIATDPSQLIP